MWQPNGWINMHGFGPQYLAEMGQSAFGVRWPQAPSLRDSRQPKRADDHYLDLRTS